MNQKGSDILWHCDVTNKSHVLLFNCEWCSRFLTTSKSSGQYALFWLISKPLAIWEVWDSYILDYWKLNSYREFMQKYFDRYHYSRVLMFDVCQAPRLQNINNLMRVIIRTKKPLGTALISRAVWRTIYVHLTHTQCVSVQNSSCSKNGAVTIKCIEFLLYIFTSMKCQRSTPLWHHYALLNLFSATIQLLNSG